VVPVKKPSILLRCFPIKRTTDLPKMSSVTTEQLVANCFVEQLAKYCEERTYKTYLCSSFTNPDTITSIEARCPFEAYDLYLRKHEKNTDTEIYNLDFVSDYVEELEDVESIEDTEDNKDDDEVDFLTKVQSLTSEQFEIIFEELSEHALNNENYWVVLDPKYKKRPFKAAPMKPMKK
jgi:hypothetical protein